MRKFLLVITLFLALLASCKRTNESKELFNHACTLFQNADIVEWMNNSPEKDIAINELDKVIEMEPKWWAPYNQKIQILKIGSYQNCAENVKSVYELWLNNNGTLDGFQKFSYACSLYCSGNESQSLRIFSELGGSYAKKDLNDEEKIIYIFSEIILGNVTKSDLKTFVLEFFEESMVQNIEDFYNLYNNNPKEALWMYV